MFVHNMNHLNNSFNNFDDFRWFFHSSEWCLLSTVSCLFRACKITRKTKFISFLFVDDDDVTTSGVTLDNVDKRVIFLNRPQPTKFCSNHISTAKYRCVFRCSFTHFYENLDAFIPMFCINFRAIFPLVSNV